MDSRGINLEQQFLTKDFFKPHELDDLRDFAQRKQAKKPLNKSSTLWSDEPESDTVDNGTQHSRLTTCANYLHWYAMHILKTAELEVVQQIDAMAQQMQQIKKRRPSKQCRSSELQDRSLSDVQLDSLFEVIFPGSELNPFSIDVQRRNRLMILLLFYLGIRGGELLNIRIQDVDFSTNRIRIVR